MAGQEAKSGLELPHVTEGVEKHIAEISLMEIDGTCLFFFPWKMVFSAPVDSRRHWACVWSQVPAGSIIIGT